MEKVIKLFHYISYIKYPILIIGIYFFYKPFFTNYSNLFESYNSGLIFLGLGIGLDSLKDYGKLTWIDKKVYHKPEIAKYYFLFLGFIIIIFIVVGAFGYFLTEETILNQLSIGLMVLGIGFLAVLKAGIQATMDFIDNEIENPDGDI